MRRVSIDPVTRLEGHGRIDLFLDEAGAVDSAYLVIPELRGFEKLVEGRPVEELPLLTSRICGVCPEAHHTAAAKAADAVYGITIPAAAEAARRLQYHAFMAGDHATHFFALGGPDLIVGVDAPVGERNVIGVVRKVGAEFGSRVMRMRKEAHEVAELLGGKAIHPVGMVPGGISRPVDATTAARLAEIGRYMVSFSRESLAMFDRAVVADPAMLELFRSDAYTSRTSYMALVDDEDRPDPYGGHVRVVDADGREVVRYDPRDYLEHVAEHVEPWTYLKFPYLKRYGWNGLSEEAAPTLVRTGPLGTLNASRAMSTPLAEEERERFFATFGGTPVHHTLAFHWARLIEMLHSAEMVVAHAADERLTDAEVRALPSGTPSEGVGCVEAPRGLLTHHYVTDERGIVRHADLIVGTTYQYPALQLSVATAARALLKPGAELDERVVNRIEMALRAYDPCFGCATHALGAGGVGIRLHGSDGALLDAVTRGEDGSLRHAGGSRG